ncbi:MAG: hypothetical protein LM590_13090, partial [Thermofilum sp.]|nr:hypothetical protein [Thermofilum sp.]
PFYSKCTPLSVNVFSMCKLKIIYEASQREDYFKKRLREKFQFKFRNLREALFLWLSFLGRSYKQILVRCGNGQ